MAKSRQAAVDVVQALQTAGFRAYFAGGCVRDELMGLTPKDYDVATSARPEQVLAIFPKAQKVGVAFGVVLVRRRGAAVEVATFRADGKYADGRHPVEVAFSNPELDAQRRDFTCNGLFSDPLTGDIMDFVGGRQDIQAKCLRAIGEPPRRFAEDHLRMLRAIRFAARLDFQIDPPTLQAIQDHAPALAQISRERIGQEMRLILTHPTRSRGVKLLLESGLLSPVWPLPTNATTNLELTWLLRLPSTAGFTVALAAMMHAIVPDTTDYLPLIKALQQSWVLSARETADLLFLWQHGPILQQWRKQRLAVLKRMLADARSADLLAWYRAATVDEQQIRALEDYVREISQTPLAPDPLVTGDDLIQMGQMPGPQFRAWLNTLYDRQLENEFSDRSAALTAARKLVEQPR